MSIEEPTTATEAKSPEAKTVVRKAAPRKPVKAVRRGAPAPDLAAPAAPQPRPDRSVSPHKKRTPLGSRNRLSFSGMDPNYYYRVINDKDDRIERALEAGYEFVESTQRLGDIQAGDSSPMGKAVHKPVGGGTTGYLMRQPMEFHNEDQEAKLRKVDELEDSTKPKTEKGEYGKGIIRT